MRKQAMPTHYERVKALPGASELLRPGLGVEQLDTVAYYGGGAAVRGTGDSVSGVALRADSSGLRPAGHAHLPIGKDAGPVLRQCIGRQWTGYGITQPSRVASTEIATAFAPILLGIVRVRPRRRCVAPAVWTIELGGESAEYLVLHIRRPILDPRRSCRRSDCQYASLRPSRRQRRALHPRILRRADMRPVSERHPHGAVDLEARGSRQHP